MAGLYVTSGGRVVRHVSLAEWNRYRSAAANARRRARAADRNARRRAQLARRQQRLEEKARIDSYKRSQRRAHIRLKQLERRRGHAAMLRRRERNWPRRRPHRPAG